VLGQRLAQSASLTHSGQAASDIDGLRPISVNLRICQGIVARTLVCGVEIVSTLLQDCSEVGNFGNVQDGHRDESRCGSLKAALRFGLRRCKPDISDLL